MFMYTRNLPFSEFWPDYLRAHSKPSTRVCHYVATGLGVVFGVYGIVTLNPLLVLAVILGCAGIAVASHHIFEGRKPLIARHAIWGARADFLVIWLALTGRLQAEMDRYGFHPDDPVSGPVPGPVDPAA